MNKAQLIDLIGPYHAAGNMETPAVNSRCSTLRRFRKLFSAAKNEIYAALVADMNRDQMETLMAEIIPLLQIIRFLEKKLSSLSKPVRVRGSMSTFPATTKLYPEPYGRVLVISTWNYPLLLALEPALGAFAAGNQVILKLSPRSPHTNAVIKRLAAETFSVKEMIVIDDELSLDETLELRFDYIFMTGSSRSGRHVMCKAAENLTPCTLELGGKNPCIVLPGANLHLAARRIVWGKFFNGGQSCAAPDYLLVHREIKEKFMNLVSSEIRRMYGKNPLASGNFTSLPDADAYNRTVKLISSGRLICGGDRDPKKLSVEPTVIDMLPENSAALAEEVFSPVLPVMDFFSEKDICDHLAEKERPLAAYCFGGSRKLRNHLIRNYSCGALVFDDVLLHFTNMNIPFGGIGTSGFGAYHGRKSFETFSHMKPVMRQSNLLDMPLRYPPYNRFIRRMIEMFFRLGR